MAENDAVWTYFNVFWNGIGAATSETVEQAVQAWGSKPFSSSAANIVAFEGFLANVTQSIIDAPANSPTLFEGIIGQSAGSILQRQRSCVGNCHTHGLAAL